MPARLRRSHSAESSNNTAMNHAALARSTYSETTGTRRGERSIFPATSPAASGVR